MIGWPIIENELLFIPPRLILFLKESVRRVPPMFEGFGCAFFSSRSRSRRASSLVLPKPNGDIAKSLKSQRTAPINIALVMHPDSEPNDDERIDWPAVGMIALAVIDALIISLGNLSGCWLILPYGRAAETVDGFDKTIMAGR